MEEILELDPNNRLTIPASLIEAMGLEPGAHFAARQEAGGLVIEYLPFSCVEQGEMPERTIHSMRKDVKI